jgi:hypothetical protein
MLGEKYYLLTLLLFIPVFLSIPARGYGQSYHIVNEVLTSEKIAPADNLNKIYFRASNDTGYLIRAVNAQKEQCDYKVSLFNLATGEILYCDTIKGIPQSFRVTDVQVRNRKVIITSYCKFIYLDIGNPKSAPYFYPAGLNYQNDQNRFDRCEFFNDTLLLLYGIHNSHPYNGKPGVYLITYNLKTLQFDNYKILGFPGISVSGVINNWLTIVKNRIYIITPLSTLMYSLDFNLESIDTVQTNLFSKIEYDSSIAYERYADSLSTEASTDIMKVINKYPSDSQTYHKSEFQHSFYSKDFLLKVLKDIKPLSFVRQMFTIDDSLIAISISKPNEDGTKHYRDLILYDPTKNNVVKKYRHLLYYDPEENLKRPEDFFVIQFHDKAHTPYMHNGYAYYYSLFPLSAFNTGKYDDLALKLLNESKKNGYKWTIYKYKFD